MIDFKKAPKGKFIIIGHKGFNQSMFHDGIDTLILAEEYASKIISGDIEVKDLAIADSIDSLDGIDIINYTGETVYYWKGCYGSFILDLQTKD